MKIRQILRTLYIALSFLAVNIGLGSYVVAASTLELKETSQEISGKDSESGVAFHASRLAGDRVVVDFYFGMKRIHADIDYAHHIDIIRSVYRANGLPAALSRQDILAFQKLLGSRFSPRPKIQTSDRLRDALGSLINLIASAPEGYTLNFPKGRVTNESFKSICPEIGHIGEASFILGKKFYYKTVLVGPICYKDPALGRCGRGGGPDFIIGWVQRFTQECLNHDECCEVSGKSPPVCGMECAAAFDAAEDGFLHAPDCGDTGGNWADSNGFTYALGDANSSGDPIPFGGVLNATSPFCPSEWDVAGTRTGKQISFTATNPSPPTRFCAASYTVTGTYAPLVGTNPSPSNNGCNTAAGKWSNSAGGSGNWNWTREGTVLVGVANAGPRPAEK
ncbi:MAG: hypothetical protein ACRECP_09940 [Methylocella sp.]